MVKKTKDLEISISLKVTFKKLYYTLYFYIKGTNPKNCKVYTKAFVVFVYY